MPNRFSMSFNKLAARGNILNFIQIHLEISEKMSAEVFDLSYNCDLERRSKSLKLVSKCRVKWSLSPYQAERNRSVYLWIQANVKSDFKKSP